MAVTASALVDIKPIDAARTFALQRFGTYDPTATFDRNALRKAFSAPHGPCVVSIAKIPTGISIEVEGADEESVLEDLIAAFRAEDGYAAFAPEHPLLAKLHRTVGGLRLVRVPWRFDTAACTVLQQRVTVREALQQWRRIAMRYGERAGDLHVFPSAERVARMESWRFEELGVDPKRTRALHALAFEVHRRNLFAENDVARVRKVMMSIRGIGPWTTENTLGFGWGDPDALPLADLHIPHLVCWALAREKHASGERADERMVELLEPYRGQRFRALRLLMASGISVPR